MSYSLLIQNRNSGKIYECASIAQTVVFSTKRTGAPASLKADLLKCGGLAFWEGDPIRFEVDGTLVFYGYVFTKEQNRWGELSVTAYDQTRYLLAKQAYRFTGATAESIIRRAASAFQLTVGTLESTGYTIPYLDFGSGKSCLDIIQSALQQVTVNTGNIVCYEHGKALPVRDGYIILNRGLAVGDRVLMLKVSSGQRYLVLSRIFEEG